MMEFTLIIDCANYYNDYSELFDYLFSVDGINDVVITSDELVTITVKYNSIIINYERIRYEIQAFLEILNSPCVYGFNKHLKKAKIYKIIRDSICCDFCYMNMIEELYETDGIMGVESNFYKKYWTDELKNEKYIIDIYYDPSILSIKDMQELEIKLDILE